MRSRHSQSSPSLSFTPAIATLTFGKASRVFAAFVSFHYLQDRVALPLYLFFVTFGAALTLLILQRPWRGKRIGIKRTKRILLAGGLLTATLYTWTVGLRSAGPLRTLLVDGAELPLLYMFAVLTRRELPEKRKTRGAFFMLLAYCLLIWDASGHVPDVNEIERSPFGQKAELIVDKLTHHQYHYQQQQQQKQQHATTGGSGWSGQDANNDDDNINTNKLNNNDGLVAGFGEDDKIGADGKLRKQGGLKTRRRLLTTFRPKVKGPGGVKNAFIEGTALRCEIGVILVLIASILVQGGRGFSRRLANELGGAKRHFALSMSASVVWIAPLAVLSCFSSTSGSILSLQMIGGITRMHINASHVLGFISVGFLWLVLPYYARAIVSTSIPSKTMMQSAVVAPFVMACLVSGVFGGASSAGGVSWVLIAAFILECVGVTLMMAGGIKSRGISELPIDTAAATGSRTALDGGSDAAAASGSSASNAELSNGIVAVNANGR